MGETERPSISWFPPRKHMGLVPMKATTHELLHLPHSTWAIFYCLSTGNGREGDPKQIWTCTTICNSGGKQHLVVSNITAQRTPLFGLFWEFRMTITLPTLKIYLHFTCKAEHDTVWDRLIFHLLKDCPNVPNGQGPRTIQISHVSGRGGSPCVITSCLPGYKLTGRWIWKLIWDLNSNTPIRDGGIPSGVFNCCSKGPPILLTLLAAITSFMVLQ